jgi:hypothetical protein
MDNDKIDELLDKLDEIARSYDHYDYGLPTDDVTKQMLRDAVIEWLYKRTGV